jgi:hypothetical protein
VRGFVCRLPTSKYDTYSSSDRRRGGSRQTTWPTYAPGTTPCMGRGGEEAAHASRARCPDRRSSTAAFAAHRKKKAGELSRCTPSAEGCQGMCSIYISKHFARLPIWVFLVQVLHQLQTHTMALSVLFVGLGATASTLHLEWYHKRFLPEISTTS